MKIMKTFSITTFIVFLLLQLCYAQTAAKAIVFKVAGKTANMKSVMFGSCWGRLLKHGMRVSI